MTHDGAGAAPAPESRRKSNVEKSRDNLEQLRRYLAAVERVPERKGAANLSAIAVASGVDRQYLYHDDLHALIADAVREKGLGMPQQARAPSGDEVPAWARKRIADLEQQVAALRAENGELRGRVARQAALDLHLAETGRLAR